MPTRRIGALMMATLVLVGLMAGSVAAQPRKPNIVVIWGDDVDIAYVFNVRQDPYESYDQAPAADSRPDRPTVHLAYRHGGRARPPARLEVGPV